MSGPYRREPRGTPALGAPQLEGAVSAALTPGVGPITICKLRESPRTRSGQNHTLILVAYHQGLKVSELVALRSRSCQGRNRPGRFFGASMNESRVILSYPTASHGWGRAEAFSTRLAARSIAAIASSGAV
jgi:hypothetical protein